MPFVPAGYPGLFNKIKTILCGSVLLLSLSAGPAALAAQTIEPAMTLEQAVIQVQQETGGKVLSASTVRRRAKLVRASGQSADAHGHVRVVTVTTEASKGPASNDSTKNPSADGDSNKEKH